VTMRPSPIPTIHAASRSQKCSKASVASISSTKVSAAYEEAEILNLTPFSFILRISIRAGGDGAEWQHGPPRTAVVSRNESKTCLFEQTDHCSRRARST
jgi:hypothetical protein